jgi:hypothetical protein
MGCSMSWRYPVLLSGCPAVEIDVGWSIGNLNAAREERGCEMSHTRSTIRRWAPAVALSALLTTPVAARGQAVVRAIIVDQKSVSETDRVHLSRFADMTEATTIAVNTTLDAGDLIWAFGPGVLVEIECTSKGRTPFRLSNGFRAVVLPPRPDVACVLQLLAGGVDVRTDETTEINAGGIVLGSKGTQYAVRLRRTGEGAVCDGVVFDGDLSVTPPSLKMIELASNNSWTYDLAADRGQRGAISEQMVQQSAAIATVFDLTRLSAVATGSPVAQQQLAEQLFALHSAVLRAPANQDVRAELGKTQEKLGIMDGARYNLKRVPALTRGEARVRDIELPVIEPQPVPVKEAVTAERRQRAAIRSAEMAVVVDPAGRALELVRAGSPAAAIEFLRPRVEASQAMARDFYALAEAYVATQDRVAARKAAGQALGAPDAATALSSSEIETLRAVLRGR